MKITCESRRYSQACLFPGIGLKFSASIVVPLSVPLLRLDKSWPGPSPQHPRDPRRGESRWGVPRITGIWTHVSMASWAGVYLGSLGSAHRLLAPDQPSLCHHRTDSESHRVSLIPGYELFSAHHPSKKTSIDSWSVLSRQPGSASHSPSSCLYRGILACQVLHSPWLHGPCAELTGSGSPSTQDRKAWQGPAQCPACERPGVTGA